MIFVVEDDATIGSLIIQALLSETPYQALLVADGFQALKIIRDINPQLLLLDYQLPRMNGIELYDQVHEIEALKGLPALFISASAPIGEIQKRHLSVVKKPFELETLFHLITRLLA